MWLKEVNQSLLKCYIFLNITFLPPKKVTKHFILISYSYVVIIEQIFDSLVTAANLCRLNAETGCQLFPVNSVELLLLVNDVAHFSCRPNTNPITSAAVSTAETTAAIIADRRSLKGFKQAATATAIIAAQVTSIQQLLQKLQLQQLLRQLQLLIKNKQQLITSYQANKYRPINTSKEMRENL